MAYIRNNIEIEGIENRSIALEGSYVLNYWENGPIFLPRNKGKIRHLNKVVIEIDSVEGRVINTPAGKVLNIYGRKIYSLVYSEKSHDKLQRTNINMPFMAYVYLPLEVEDFCDLEVSVIDAFFEVIDNRKVHNHILYLIKFNKKSMEAIEKSEEFQEEVQNQLTLSDLERMIMASPLKDILKANQLSLLNGESVSEQEESSNIVENVENDDISEVQEEYIIEKNNEVSSEV
ncbi:hypothetical protein [Clostridium cylindrosporum]|uniref:Uncharacterized protein n=1 Tax=Clostridium cylindrosporum DSM 605 TaxID=1121307 RepID=A0A0J8DAP8_CLOCY|nr:hypothetical protein [Clostridium cylindrosporum]KMT21378.1 hypothetical protein CLCY_2c01380 [Clostridium cylindrosporum DSM 605]